MDRIINTVDKIISIMVKIPYDKLSHSFYGTLTYVLVSVYSPLLAIAATILSALAKELYDEYKYGGFDILDIMATIFFPVLLYFKVLFL